ncbi:striatin-interacting protein 1 [Nilaparvata lugens]|uniref:striatin-interacting protein 1 n=1 Tax=Nilaparvata lugens TaxID=108931 RepID=UPI00193D3344|nr:striatin-interacting protein 1 [Nilaparvata lugens]
MINVINMDRNGNGKRGVLNTRNPYGGKLQRQDSDGELESTDLEFIYDDADSYTNEIAELYGYTEQPEYQLNVKAFEDQMEMYKHSPSWQKLDQSQKRSVVCKLLDQLEVSNKTLRMRAGRCFLYLLQGCWAEMQSDKEQQACTKENALLIYELGVFHTFVDLLNIEIENSSTANTAMRKLAVSLADSLDLRVILSVIYIIVEVFRNVADDDTEQWKKAKENFKQDISNPIGDELVAVKLFGMVTRFCGGSAPHFPMKKVLLLLWKIILLSLGGIAVLRELKNVRRIEHGLPPLEEDTVEVARHMRASSPPASAADLIETQSQKRGGLGGVAVGGGGRPLRRSLMKQSSLDHEATLAMEFEDDGGGESGGGRGGEGEEIRVVIGGEGGGEGGEGEEGGGKEGDDMPQPPSPPPHSDTPPPIRKLPWLPKVRQKDLDIFLENTRVKFVGFPLQGDRESLFGLPQPIHEGVDVLKRHIYTSLAEIQVQQEDELAKSPISLKETNINMTPTEILYQAMLPNLPQYMIALLKILLAAAPTSKAKTDSINIMADVLPEEMPMTVLQSMKLGTDVNRHKEIIVKAVSGILLLLLKHFKLNHIYQFEFMSQHLVFANCIPLVLKFFNQNIMSYVGTKNVIPILDFPACVIGDQPELTIDSLGIGDNQQHSWRNVFSCINLLRILNKLIKWKHSRIMMLVVFKSAPILKRTLKVRHAMMQLYVLKLLKIQTKYLGRQWRKSNMMTMSAIYQKVRHRLNDDWAYGNDIDAKPWDFQADECALRASVDRFNNRKYSNNVIVSYKIFYTYRIIFIF